MREMFLLKIKAHKLVEVSLKTYESYDITWQIALLPFLFDGELLFVNTRLSVKVKLSVFNLVKAIQSCREEVRISSMNFKPINVTLVLVVIMLSNQDESKARVPNNATYFIFALLSNAQELGSGIYGIEKKSSINVFIKCSFLPRHIFTNFDAKSCYSYEVWRCKWHEAVAILNKL